MAEAGAAPATLRALLPDTPGSYSLQFSTSIDGRSIELPFRLHLPRGYDTEKSPWPLLVFLHDQKQRGRDMAALGTIGVERMLQGDANFRNGFKFIAITPQCPADSTWTDAAMTRALLSLIDLAGATFRIDPDRISLTGVGMGGEGAWRLAMLSPQRFAAIVVNSASAVDPPRAAMALRHTAAWVVASGNDKESAGAMGAMVESLKNAGGDMRFAQLGKTRDECIAQFFASAETYTWLGQQKRRTEKDRQEREVQHAQQRRDEMAKLPKTPGHHRLQYQTWVGAQNVTLIYQLYIPRGYEKDNELWPGLVFLHAGDAQNIAAGQFAYGPAQEIVKNERFREWYPFVTIYPAAEHSPAGLIAVERLIGELRGGLRIDKARLYVTGAGPGATAAWQLATKAPEMFAAVATIGARDLADPARVAGLPPAWLIASGADGPASQTAQRLAAALRAGGADAELSVVPGADASLHARYYSDQRFYERLLQRASGPTPATRPAGTPLTDGEHRIAFQTKVGARTIDLPYLLSLPRGYEASQGKMPAMLYLHDPADAGTGLGWVFNYDTGPGQRGDRMAGTFPVVGICPQCPPDRSWDDPEVAKAVVAALDDAVKRIRYDADRLYISGRGAAGAGAWHVTVEAPERFAAAALVQPGNINPEHLKLLSARHKYLPVWITAVGNANNLAANAGRLADALRKIKAPVEASIQPDVAALPWRAPYYSDPRFTEPLLKLRRPTPEQRAARDERDRRQEMLAVPTSPGIHKKVFEAQIDAKTVELPYAIFIPAGYAQTQEKQPLVLYLHDENARGSDGAGLFQNGPFPVLESSKEFREKCRLLVVAPQCPANRRWDEPQMMNAAAALLDNIGKELRVDAERVYLTGLRTGASAIWHMALTWPDRFAALAPVQTGTVPLEQADRLRYIAAWINADYNDQAAAALARRMGSALSNTVNDVQVHIPWQMSDPPWQSFFADPKLYEWLLAHRRLTPAERKARDQRQQVVAAAANPDKPGYHKLKCSTYVNGKPVDLPYLAYLPQGYDKSDQRWPVLISLCGAGELQPDLSGMFIHGPCAHLQANQALREWFPMIVLNPLHQNSAESAKSVIAMLDEAMRKFRIDPDRVYITGISLGGTSTWWVAQEAPERFAAITPICGRALNPETIGPRLKYLSTWIMVGGSDGDFTVGAPKMLDALRKAGADAHLTVWPGHGHDVFAWYYPDKRYYEWLLSHKRLTPEQRALRDRGQLPPPVPQAEGQYIRQLDVPGPRPWKLTYGLYLPRGYGKSPQNWPLMVHLHHENDRGTELATIFNWGSDTDPRKDPAARHQFPMIGLAPHCPTDRQWSDPEMLKVLATLLDQVAKEYRADDDRVYLAGTGPMGQLGVWALAAANPDRFAAVAPWFAESALKPEMAAKLRFANVSLTTPAKDQGAVARARQLVELLRPHRAQVALNLMETGPAGPIWQPYYTEPKLVTWLLAQKRPGPRERQARSTPGG